MRTDRQLGDKLGPKLAALMSQAVIHTRRALGPHESRVMQAALQALIDRAGHEVAGLWRPFTSQILADRGDQIHPLMRQHLERISSGAHQWESIAGHAQMAATSVLSQTLGNLVAPVAYAINSHDRSLVPDLQSFAQGVAIGVMPYSEGDEGAAVNGYTPGSFRLAYDLAQNVPDPSILGQLANRGLLSEARLAYWTTRGGFPEELRNGLEELRHQLLSPADLALAVLRGDMSEAEGRRLAAQTGVSAADFAVLLANTGEPLGLEQLLEAYRRGYINRQRLVRGIRQSRVRDEWADVAEELRYSPVPTADAIDAWLRGHVDESRARTIAEQNGVLPDQIQILLDDAGNPPAPEQLLELWRRGVLNEARVHQGMREGRLRDEWITPVLQLRYEPLSTADAIDAWLRGHLGEQEARQIAEENGLLPRDVPAAFANAGNPLGLVQLLEALRRGFIDESRFEQGFRQSRYRDEWSGTALKLGYSPLSTADAIEALIQNHMSEKDARKAVHDNGLEPQYFEVLRETAGEPLSRTEFTQLFNRGKIKRAEFEQGLKESRLKDKYVSQAIELHTRLPEPREIVTALTDGVLKREQASKLLAEYGYSTEVITMLIAVGEVRATGPHRQLVGSEILKLYSTRTIDQVTATQLLGQLHYSAESITLQLRLADYQLQQKILNTGISAVRAHYVARRISDLVARADLAQLGLPADAVRTYIQVWSMERSMHPKSLTEAQIVAAYKKGLFTPTGESGTDKGTQDNSDIAKGRLVDLGYDETDAGLLLAGA